MWIRIEMCVRTVYTQPYYNGINTSSLFIFLKLNKGPKSIDFEVICTVRCIVFFPPTDID